MTQWDCTGLWSVLSLGAARGSDSGLVTCAAFKAVRLRADPRSGGFDSHPLPPTGADRRGRPLGPRPGCPRNVSLRDCVPSVALKGRGPPGPARRPPPPLPRCVSVEHRARPMAADLHPNPTGHEDPARRVTENDQKTVDMWSARPKLNSVAPFGKTEVGSTHRLDSAGASLAGFAPPFLACEGETRPGLDDRAFLLGRKREGGRECPNCIRRNARARTAGAVG